MGKIVETKIERQDFCKCKIKKGSTIDVQTICNKWIKTIKYFLNKLCNRTRDGHLIWFFFPSIVFLHVPLSLINLDLITSKKRQNTTYIIILGRCQVNPVWMLQEKDRGRFGISCTYI